MFVRIWWILWRVTTQVMVETDARQIIRRWWLGELVAAVLSCRKRCFNVVSTTLVANTDRYNADLDRLMVVQVQDDIGVFEKQQGKLWYLDKPAGETTKNSEVEHRTLSCVVQITRPTQIPPPHTLHTGANRHLIIRLPSTKTKIFIKKLFLMGPTENLAFPMEYCCTPWALLNFSQHHALQQPVVPHAHDETCEEA